MRKRRFEAPKTDTHAPHPPTHNNNNTHQQHHSTGLFVLGYCAFYYHFRSDMSGFMQAAFFFGYNGLACYAFFLMLGAVGFRASHLFVRHIYRAIKIE